MIRPFFVLLVAVVLAANVGGTVYARNHSSSSSSPASDVDGSSISPPFRICPSRDVVLIGQTCPSIPSSQSGGSTGSSGTTTHTPSVKSETPKSTDEFICIHKVVSGAVAKGGLIAIVGGSDAYENKSADTVATNATSAIIMGCIGAVNHNSTPILSSSILH